MHVYKDFIQCKSVCDVKQGIDPYPCLLSRVTDDGQISQPLQPVKDQYLGLKRAKRRNAFQTGAKIYLSKKIFWGYGHFKA